MANGVPDHPPLELQDKFVESEDDETCPQCGWDAEASLLDVVGAYRRGNLLAIEEGDRSPFMTMAGAQLVCNYFRCPECATFFTLETELTLGAMT